MVTKKKKKCLSFWIEKSSQILMQTPVSFREIFPIYFSGLHITVLELFFNAIAYPIHKQLMSSQ